jgi:tRNA A-37 threonylcarbamoyl transferase component Bud32
MEYVEGENLTKIVKRSMAQNSAQAIDALDLIEKVGATLAKVHSLDVALGDTKPENIFVGKTGEIYLMDLEQATRKGDVVWDIAEFLYYAGHDISPFADAKKLKIFAQTFIKGYLQAGGKIGDVESAGTPKYTKVFSIFTYPHIMYALSNACRRANRLKV